MAQYLIANPLAYATAHSNGSRRLPERVEVHDTAKPVPALDTSSYSQLAQYPGIKDINQSTLDDLFAALTTKAAP